MDDPLAHVHVNAVKRWVWHCNDSARVLNSLNLRFEGKTVLNIFRFSKYITRLLPLGFSSELLLSALRLSKRHIS